MSDFHVVIGQRQLEPYMPFLIVELKEGLFPKRMPRRASFGWRFKFGAGADNTPNEIRAAQRLACF